MGQAFADAAVSGPLILAIGACLLAGLVSFASPCIVPLVPGYLSYLAGLVGAEAPATSIAELGGSGKAVDRSGRWRVLGAAALFVGGFTAAFLLMTMSVFGLAATIRLNAETLMRIGGGITIIMGLAFIGLVPALAREVRFAPRPWTTLAGAPLLGGVFALGWTPCIGPTLAGIMSIIVGTNAAPARGAALVVAYCVGLGLPFIALAVGSTAAVRAVGWLRRNSRRIQVAGGVLMIAVGLALVTGYWSDFVDMVRRLFVSNIVMPI
ncbi:MULTISPECIES: cytochrome c biogenesis CcdA family protein [Tsukamurella]|uniref:Cytochrome C biogenesis protein transmembrane region n=6 Tax=Tsukamurella TaxID=2060 RepID=A0A3P8K0H3_TSUPA|nr:MULTISPECIES: cytochrome c biogenesis CcdA family protein [Tsukamurella]KXO98900.1 cytochrome C biogenesis protein ResC [Tsukamurella tyrosinosolvens]KXP01874.1 cytochrome C biogenesis protein ResC [Tsukamurella tyrosinosolvens]KZL95065.1 cytochrome C biogenesis protein ResC [Tsukamurella tyrosinosolvens]MCA4997622.1 cytochrome c biogenesis protein CcdA [Tsukamurella tyrosinosolvens]MEC4614409.1 cytochrome c biogenesis CcdA family protein [Tsukamurella tyrosinosolvens]